MNFLPAFQPAAVHNPISRIRALLHHLDRLKHHSTMPKTINLQRTALPCHLLSYHQLHHHHPHVRPPLHDHQREIRRLPLLHPSLQKRTAPTHRTHH